MITEEDAIPLHLEELNRIRYRQQASMFEPLGFDQI
jgi:hypothetical protein